jgi:hypothetical protein
LYYKFERKLWSKLEDQDVGGESESSGESLGESSGESSGEEED